MNAREKSPSAVVAVVLAAVRAASVQTKANAALNAGQRGEHREGQNEFATIAPDQQTVQQFKETKSNKY